MADMATKYFPDLIFENSKAPVLLVSATFTSAESLVRCNSTVAADAGF
jgi:hypothetical protein